MKIFSILSVALFLNGCVCFDIYQKSVEAYECSEKQFEIECSKLKKDQDKAACLDKVQLECVEEVVSGKPKMEA